MTAALPRYARRLAPPPPTADSIESLLDQQDADADAARQQRIAAAPPPLLRYRRRGGDSSHKAQLHVPDGRGGRVWVTVIEGEGAAEWVAQQRLRSGTIPMLVWPDPETGAIRMCANPGGLAHVRLLGPGGAILPPLERV